MDENIGGGMVVKISCNLHIFQALIMTDLRFTHIFVSAVALCVFLTFAVINKKSKQENSQIIYLSSGK